ncbi:restriction endonuclease subunit S [uncultured Arcanobacterium sp.]|uniref:restriction endonuclease subunit S n=1 Tax=uncultured Arcanobacterium sp. TaxID=487520 RepID=UPI00260A4900|nr:restriction endonuclease subunit S [uncultured Arcanobacterium sp.]
MSRIDDLLAQYCPDGVEYKLLGNVLINFDSKRKPVTKKDRREGIFPYYGANGIQDYVDDYIFDGTYLLIGEDGSVIKEDKTPVINWASGKIWVNNHAHVLQCNSEDTLLRYVYFYLQTVDITKYITGGTQPKLNQKNLNKIPIAIPALQVQEEIVWILDSFTQLEAELEAELEARRQQYEYYRDSLLDINNPHNPLADMLTQYCPDGVEQIPLKELASIQNGCAFDSKEFNNLNLGLPLVRIRDINTGFSNTYYSGEYKPEYIIQNGDLLVGMDGDFKPIRWSHGKALLNQRVCKINPNPEQLNKNYLFHFLFISLEQISSKIQGSTVKHLSTRDLNKYPIPVPPLPVQERIVEILDKFDALVNDLSSGLPAEIQARRQQYEYYRDQLLSFPAAK